MDQFVKDIPDAHRCPYTKHACEPLLLVMVLAESLSCQRQNPIKLSPVVSHRQQYHMQELEIIRRQHSDCLNDTAMVYS